MIAKSIQVYNQKFQIENLQIRTLLLAMKVKIKSI